MNKNLTKNNFSDNKIEKYNKSTSYIHNRKKIIELSYIYGFDPYYLSEITGILPRTIISWYKTLPEFRQAIQEAEAFFRMRMVNIARKNALEQLKNDKNGEYSLKILQIYDKTNIAELNLESQDTKIQIKIKI